MNITETEIVTRMKPEGVHVIVNDTLELIVENDPFDLVMRVPSDGSLMFTLDEAVSHIFGSLNRQDYLGMVTLLGIVIFSAFEEQLDYVNRISQ